MTSFVREHWVILEVVGQREKLQMMVIGELLKMTFVYHHVPIMLKPLGELPKDLTVLRLLLVGSKRFLWFLWFLTSRWTGR